MSEVRTVFECSTHGLVELALIDHNNTPTCPHSMGCDETCCFELDGPYEVTVSPAGKALT